MLGVSSSDMTASCLPDDCICTSATASVVLVAQSFGSPVELMVGEHVVKVSNPEKPYFPAVGITKLEVVQHYLDCGDGILRALRNRPTTLERWPGGVVEGARISTREGFKGDAFYQKRVPQGAPAYVDTAHTFGDPLTKATAVVSLSRSF